MGMSLENPGHIVGIKVKMSRQFIYGKSFANMVMDVGGDLVYAFL